MKENDKDYVYKSWHQKSEKPNAYGVRNSIHQLFLNSFIILRQKESSFVQSFRTIGEAIGVDVSWKDMSTKILQEALQLVLVMNLSMRGKSVAKVLDKDVSTKWDKSKKSSVGDWSVFSDAIQKYKSNVEIMESVGQLVTYKYFCGTLEIIAVIKGINKELKKRNEPSWLSSLTVTQLAHFFELLDDVSDLVELAGGNLESEKEKELLCQFVNNKSINNTNDFKEREKKLLKLSNEAKMQVVNDYITEELLILNSYLDYHITANKSIQDEWVIEKMVTVKDNVYEVGLSQNLNLNFYGPMWVALYEKINTAQQKDLFRLDVDIVNQMNLCIKRNEVLLSNLEKEEMRILIKDSNVTDLSNMISFIDKNKLVNPNGYAFYKINILDYLMVQKNKSALAQIPNEKLVEFKFKKKYNDFTKIADIEKDFFMPGLVIKKVGENICFGALNIDNDDNERFLRLVKNVVQDLVMLEEKEPLNYQGILAKENESLMKKDLLDRKELLVHNERKTSLKF